MTGKTTVVDFLFSSTPFFFFFLPFAPVQSCAELHLSGDEEMVCRVRCTQKVQPNRWAGRTSALTLMSAEKRCSADASLVPVTPWRDEG